MDETCKQIVDQAGEALQRDDFKAAFGRRKWVRVLAQLMTGQHNKGHGRQRKVDLRRDDTRFVVSQVGQVAVSVLFSWSRVSRGSRSNSRFRTFERMLTATNQQSVVM